MDSSPTRPAHHTRGHKALFTLPTLGVLLIALCIAAAFRIIVFNEVYQSNPERIVSPDTVRYEVPALALLENGSMRDGLPVNETQDVHVAPAYPWFIYAVYAVFGEDHRALVYAQIALSLLNILLVYFLGSAIWSNRSAAAAASLFALAPLHSLYSSILLSETLFVFSVLLLCNLAVRFLKYYSFKSTMSLAIFLGLAFGVSALVRPISYYLVFPFLIALFIFHCTLKNVSIKRFVLSALCILIGFSVVVGPWQIRNKSIADEALFTDNPGQIMLYWKAAGMIAYRDGVPAATVREQLRRAAPTDFSSISDKHAYEKKVGLDIIKSDIPAYIKFSINGLRSILIGPGLKKFGNYFDGENAGSVNGVGENALETRTGFKSWYLLIIAYSVLYLLAIYLLCLVGCVSFWRRGKNRIVLVFCMAVAAYFVLASTGHTAADSRMRIPAMPLIILFSGIGLTSLLGLNRSSRKTKKTR